MQILLTIYLTLLALTTLTGLVSFKRLTGPFRLLTILVLYVFIVELLGRYLISLGFKNLSPLYHLNTLVLIGLTASVYLRIVRSDSYSQRFVIILSAICWLVALLNTLFHQSIFTIPSFSIAANAFQSICLSLLIFNQMINSPTRTPILKQSLFWLNSGTFIFYSANFVGFILYNEYYQLKGVAKEWLFYLNWIGNMILYSCYLVGFYFNQKSS